MTLSSTDFLSQIDAYLLHFFDRRTHKATEIHPQYQRLWRELERTTMAGGKRLRPKMVLLAYEAHGGTDTQALLPVAAAIELLHSSLLIHDDIMDRELTRRGALNVTGAYSTSHYSSVPSSDRLHHSNSAALLGGDVLLSAAMELIDDSSFSPAHKAHARRIMHSIIFDVAAGQLLDSEAAFLPDHRADTLTIARYKTASYSFNGPLLMGATLADDTSSHDDLMVFASHLGVAFQLNDDLISTFGDSNTTGKTTDGDLREGKYTYIIEYFLQHASDEDLATFHALFGRSDMSEADANILRDIIISSGALAHTEVAIDEHVQHARAAVNRLEVDSSYRQAFEELISLSVRRQT